ncbi:MAG: DHA2 family efflux MFS transporter permease subunit [Clostridiales Family XIII bacterium]|jgi:EmrB/QacA subfamily drug resistance transporter|nr:DHA2 family efflux MFS transporter permease subunit [Clostridiales Family XIII bacterium]
MPKEQKSTVAVLMLGAFLSVLNQTLVNPALPSIMAELGISATMAQYLVTGFTLVNAVIIACSAFLMDRFPTRKLFMAVFGLFFAGSMLAAWGASFGILLAGRILQAVCAGVMMPLSMTILLLLSPREKRGSAMGMYSLVIMVAPAIGPVLSGILTDGVGWHIMFLIMAALSVFILLSARFGLKDVGKTKPVALDKLSVVLSSLGLFALLYGFSALGSSGTLIPALIAIVIGAIILVFFSMRQLKLEKPFLQIRVLADKQFRTGSIVLMLMSACLTAVSVTLPIYIQTVLGLSATISGIVMIPGAVLGAVAGYFAGKLHDKFGARRLSIIGVFLPALGSLGMTMFGFETPVAFMIVTYGMIAAGLMFTNPPVSLWALGNLPNDILHHGNAVQSTLRQVGSTFGVAIMVAAMSLVTALSSGQSDRQAQLTGITAAYWLSAGIALICLIIVIVKIRDRKKSAASTEEADDDIHAVMSTPPYTVPSNATISVAVEKFMEYKTSGLPVVDGQDHLVGFISDGDILRYLSNRDVEFVTTEYAYIFPDRETFIEKATELLGDNIMEIATKHIISVERTTSLSDVCHLFSRKKLNKLPVTQNGVLVGTISRGDIMRTLMKGLPLGRASRKGYR